MEGFVNKIRGSIVNLGLDMEKSSVLENIFREFDSYVATKIIA